jgi:hypothetical protein
MTSLAMTIVFQPEEEPPDLTDIQSPGYSPIPSEVQNSTERLDNAENVSFYCYLLHF